MKFKYTALCSLLLLVGCLLSSCVREDLSGCYSKNLLLMSYRGDGKAEIFPAKICRVEMYVFDAENNCVDRNVLPQEQVEKRTVELPALDPGEYCIVCLGNTHHTKVNNIASCRFDEMVFAAEDYLTGEGPVSGNDSLYYASVNYTVTGDDQIRTAEFASSHYDVLVEVAGIVGTDARAKVLPAIEIRGVSPCTDFENRACGEATDYLLETTHEAGKGLLTARANIMRHSQHENVNVCVRNASGEILAEVNLADFLTANPEIDCSMQEVLIPIHFEFKAGEVTISVPSWWNKPVKPEF